MKEYTKQGRHDTTIYGSLRVYMLILDCLLSKGSGFALGHTALKCPTIAADY